MGMIKKPPPCVRFAAVFSSEDRLIQLVWERLESHWGKIAALSPAFEFIESPYYLKTMQLADDGQGSLVLRKQMAIFASPYDPSELPADKLASNQWEDTWTAQWTAQWTSQWRSQRTAQSTAPDPVLAGLSDSATGLESPKRWVNIDPGYMSMTKLVLASTKNREHRLYLRDGIYAEVTLAFRDQAWKTMPWTYADYQRPDVLEFLTQARKGFTQSVAGAKRIGPESGGASGADS